MYRFLKATLNFLTGGYRKALTALGMALTALLGVLAYGWSKKREGALEASTKALRDDAKKLEKAREAAYEEKRDVSGLSDSDLIDRLRRRDGDWGRL